MSENVVRGKCTECQHEFTIAHLPMAVMKLAKLLKRAACPKCGSIKVNLA